MKLKKHTVFIIEDNPVDISLILEALGDDYDLRVFTSGQNVFKALDKDSPDVILLDIMLPGIGGFAICERLKAAPSTRGIPVLFLTSHDTSDYEEKALAMGAVDFVGKPVEPTILNHRVRNQVDIFRQSSARQMEAGMRLLQSENETMQHMAVTLLRVMDPHTGNHIENTKKLFTILAERFSSLHPNLLDLETVDVMAQASALHDIGKAGIPPRILCKKGPLSSEEFEEMRKHTRIGAEIIETLESVMGRSDFLRYSREMALFHHEKWDGTGYPIGLRGESIPLSARLMSLVDVYEALTSMRVYREAAPHETVCRIILEGDGRIVPGHFDPRVLEAFRVAQMELACAVRARKGWVNHAASQASLPIEPTKVGRHRSMAAGAPLLCAAPGDGT